jgi:hypothetical protein
MAKTDPKKKPTLAAVRAAEAAIRQGLTDAASAAEPPEVATPIYELGVMHALQWVAGDRPKFGKKYGL